MANEVRVPPNPDKAPSGSTAYFTIRNASGQIWNTAGAAFETYNAANIADYDIALTEQGSGGFRVGSLPAAVIALGGDVEIVAHVRAGATPAESDVPFAQGTIYVDTYDADIDFRRDQSNTTDEYRVQWFKNAAPVTSGVTSPTIQVVTASTGVDLIASTAMTAVAAGLLKYDATGASRQTLGEAVKVVVTATIDGATRTFTKILGRDSV